MAKKKHYAGWIFLAFILLVLVAFFGYAIWATKYFKPFPPAPEGSVYNDDVNHFHFVLPIDWQSMPVAPNANIKFRAQSPDGKNHLYVAVLQTKAKVDLEKLTELGKTTFKDAGTLLSEEKFPELPLIDPVYIILTFKSADSSVRVMNFARAHFGYWLLMENPADDPGQLFLEVTGSFDSKVPFKEMMSVGGFNYIKHIGALLLVVLMNFVSLAFRRGLAVKSKLNEIKTNAKRDGIRVNEKWKSLYNKTLLKILGSAASIPIGIGVFVLLYGFAGLLIIIAIILGFFGIGIKLDDSVGDSAVDYI
ncbi:MAG TPA: hypothetical protein PKW95_08120 [bacterium]|nr:hypothetical protein [bacterium]